MISLILISGLSYYLITCEHYDDGIIGRIALCALSFTAALGAFQHMTGQMVFSPISQVIFWAIAVFEARHIYIISRSPNLIDLITRSDTEWKPERRVNPSLRNARH